MRRRLGAASKEADLLVGGVTDSVNLSREMQRRGSFKDGSAQAASYATVGPDLQTIALMGDSEFSGAATATHSTEFISESFREMLTLGTSEPTTEGLLHNITRQQQKRSHQSSSPK